MHNRIAHLYSHVQLAGNKTPFKKVKDAFDKAAKYIHTKGSFSSDDLAHKDVRPLIDETNNVLKTAFSKTIETEMPAAMLQKLQDDVFLFSGMKTYTQLKEASLLLTDANKNIKSWELFRNDIQKIDSTYNENYLRAEHQHAVAAVQSAGQYHEYMQDADRYNLQIRTAGDDHVRASHAALNGITLPADSPFWNTHWTPFDWGCRCRIIQVLKGKFDVTDIDSANKASEKAIGELFKYNPGYEQAIFPPKHPYYKTSKQAMDVVKSMLPEQKIKHREADYHKYKADENYTDVEFNNKTGGLKATHKLHEFHPKTGHYEKEARDILFNNSNKIVLEQEKFGKNEIKEGVKHADGYLNDSKCEIATIVGSGNNTIKRALNHCRQKNAETAILYFPDAGNFSESKYESALKAYNGQTKYRFKKIVLIVGKDIK